MLHVPVDDVRPVQLAEGACDPDRDLEEAPCLHSRADLLVERGHEVVGVDVHIGSQLTSLDPLEAAFTGVGRLVADHQGDTVDLWPYRLTCRSWGMVCRGGARVGDRGALSKTLGGKKPRTCGAGLLVGLVDGS